jgi:hypothetical protein
MNLVKESNKDIVEVIDGSKNETVMLYWNSAV